MSQIPYVELRKVKLDKSAPCHAYKSKDLCSINGAPLITELAPSVFKLLLANKDTATLGLGDSPLVGSYQGLATGDDPSYLAILRGANLDNLSIKTGIDSLRKITRTDICSRTLGPSEIENGIDDSKPHFVPFVKATRTTRFTYESPLYIDWSKTSIKRMKSYTNKKGRIASRFQNKEKYFLPCMVSNGEEGILSTFFVENSVPAVSTNIILPEDDRITAKYLCGFLNSSLASYITRNVLNGSLKGMSSHWTAPLKLENIS